MLLIAATNVTFGTENPRETVFLTPSPLHDPVFTKVDANMVEFAVNNKRVLCYANSERHLAENVLDRVRKAVEKREKRVYKFSIRSF